MEFFCFYGIAIIGVLYKYRYKALPQASGNYGEKPYEEGEDWTISCLFLYKRAILYYKLFADKIIFRTFAIVNTLFTCVMSQNTNNRHQKRRAYETIKPTITDDSARHCGQQRGIR